MPACFIFTQPQIVLASMVACGIMWLHLVERLKDMQTTQKEGMKMRRQREYKQSPWSGQAYKSAPSVDELTKESKDVLKSHPSISNATGLDAVDKFIEQYKAEKGIA